MSINILPEVEKISEKIIQTRRDIHQNPELGFQEFRTSALIAKRLEAIGLDVKTGVGKTGVTGTLTGGKKGPAIAFRADMDALPMQETGDLSFKSQTDGVMHACGHDGHVAILLGVAEILSSQKNMLSGTIKFVFQPAEEGEGGAQYMIADGVLDGIEEMYGLHLWNYQQYGTIGVKPGAILASADIFDLTIRGKGGHGAAPQGSQDTIIAAAHLITTFQTIVSRNTNPLESTVVSVGTINGGHSFNIIADEVKLTGTTRAYTEDNRLMIKQRMNEIIRGTEITFGVIIELNYQDGYPPTINDDRVTDRVYKSARKIVEEGVGLPFMSMGGEDFAYYAKKVPACFFMVGSAPDDDNLMDVPHHCSHFNFNENALLISASALVQIARDRLIF
ncbi:MAG: amidohydrolase [Candidatus Marinimicrobia bacterium]|nr:amidohydrolase [Candidatus Neomarinimicrobiota bacterium]